MRRPTSRACWSDSGVRSPGISLILLQLVEHTNILREAHGFEGSHVFAAGKDVSALHAGVDLHHGAGNEFLFIQLHCCKQGLQRRNEISPDDRFIRNGGDGAGGYHLALDDLEALLQKHFTLLAGCARVEKHMQRIKLLIFRVYAITGETSAESVGAVMHRLHGICDHLAGHSLSFPGDHRCNGASGGDPYLTFNFHSGLRPFG